MKVAIAAESNELSANVDSRFGRCSYFAIYDTETDEVKYIENEAKKVKDAAGPAAVRFLASNNVKVIYAGEFGEKIVSLLEDLSIKSIKLSNQTVEEVINQLKK